MTIALPNNYIKKTPFWADSFELVNLRDLQASSFLEKWFPTFSFSTFSCASVPVSVRERRRKKESNPLVIFAISELRYFQREYICDLWVARFSTRISLWSLSCEIFNENILTRGGPIVHWSDLVQRERERQRLEGCPVCVKSHQSKSSGVGSLIIVTFQGHFCVFWVNFQV